jgi:hypothetical protein
VRSWFIADICTVKRCLNVSRFQKQLHTVYPIFIKSLGTSVFAVILGSRLAFSVSGIPPRWFDVIP